MDKYIILVAGVPASGKTTFSEYLNDKLHVPVVSKDQLKELLFDSVGFNSRAEKVKLGVASMNILMYFAERCMEAGESLIIENNFIETDKTMINKLINKYDYNAITVLFEGDLKVIYKRFIERDSSPTRHRGHVINTVYPEPESVRTPYVIPMTEDGFINRMINEGMSSFSMNENTIYVDTTDFSKVSHDAILEQIQKVIAKNK